MRLHELSYLRDGTTVTVTFDPRLTVISGLTAARRRLFADRLLDALRGDDAGDGTALVVVDGSGSRLRLESPFAWLGLLGIEPDALSKAMLLGPAAFDRSDHEEHHEVILDSPELSETREALTRAETDYQGVLAGHRHVQSLRERLRTLDDRIGRIDEERARRRHGQAVLNVRRLEAELAQVNGFEPPGPDRPHPNPAPASGPSAPWVPVLAQAHNRYPDLWPRAERASRDRAVAAQLSVDLGGTGRHLDLVTRLVDAHEAVKAAEHDLAAAKLPARAMGARRRLVRAAEQEQALLHQAGFTSWLAFQMRRIEVLLEPGAQRPLRAAEAEAERAMAAWQEAAGDVDPAAALAARPEIEAYAARLSASQRDDAAPLPETEPLPNEPPSVQDEAAREPSPPAVRRSTDEISLDLYMAQEFLSHFGRPDWDAAPLITDEPPDPVRLADDRARLADEIQRASRHLPHPADLASRCALLRRRLWILDGGDRANDPVVSFEKAEMVLLGRFAAGCGDGDVAGLDRVPLLVDDALARFARHEKVRLLDFLTRLSGTSQVVYLTDDAETVEWASGRAASGEVALTIPPAVERNLTATRP